MKFFLTKYFKKQLKKYLRKDPSLKENLEKGFVLFQPKSAVSLGKGVYKLRIKIQNRGKSGGYRVYVLLFAVKNTLVPLCIYAKNVQGNLSSDELEKHLGATLAELSAYEK